MSAFQANVLLNLDLDLDLTGRGALHARLAGALRQAIRDGRLPPGSVLPPSRVLAAELGCSRWVVTEADAQLATAGYTDARVGSGTRVRQVDVAGERQAPSRRPASRPAIDMAPGLPELHAFPLTRWAAAIRAAAAGISAADLGHPDPAGHGALRELVGEHLSRVRGADPGQASVTICGRATEGLSRICLALRKDGCRAMAVEDPCWHRIREVAARSGLRVLPVSVDGEGIRADLPGEVGAVVVTPAHQFPTGVVLSAARRAALLAWARNSGGLIIQDDYDAEFRYDGRPVGTMQGTDPSRVVLLGSVSKTLSPALGIGWIVTPRRLADAVRQPGGTPAPPVLDQLAFAAFLRAGWYDRHLRAARKRYRGRRDTLVRALAAYLPGARVQGIAAGLHLVLSLPDDVDAAAVRAAALRRGVRVANLDTYRAHPDPRRPGLVLGYGNLAYQDIETAVRALAAAGGRK